MEERIRLDFLFDTSALLYRLILPNFYFPQDTLRELEKESGELVSEMYSKKSGPHRTLRETQQIESFFFERLSKFFKLIEKCIPRDFFGTSSYQVIYKKFLKNNEEISEENIRNVSLGEIYKSTRKAEKKKISPVIQEYHWSLEKIKPYTTSIKE